MGRRLKSCVLLADRLVASSLVASRAVLARPRGRLALLFAVQRPTCGHEDADANRDERKSCRHQRERVVRLTSGRGRRGHALIGLLQHRDGGALGLRQRLVAVDVWPHLPLVLHHHGLRCLRTCRLRS